MGKSLIAPRESSDVRNLRYSSAKGFVAVTSFQQIQRQEIKVSVKADLDSIRVDLASSREESR